MIGGEQFQQAPQVSSIKNATGLPLDLLGGLEEGEEHEDKGSEEKIMYKKSHVDVLVFNHCQNERNCGSS